MDKTVTVDYRFTAPGPVIRPIGAMTLFAATVAAGIEGTIPKGDLTPLEVLKEWPVEGWAVLKAAVMIDHAPRGYNRLCAEENSERQSNDSMSTLCQRVLEVVNELYAVPVERVASCACIVYSEDGETTEVDIDRVTVDGVEMTRQDFARYIDPAAVKAAAKEKAKQEGRE